MNKMIWTEKEANPTSRFFSEMIFDEIVDGVMHLQFVGLTDQELSINEMHIGRLLGRNC